MRDIQKCADELSHYLLALEDFKGYKPQSVGQSKVSGGATEGSSPLNVSVFDLCRDIETLAVSVGGYRIRDLVTLPGGVETALEVRALHSRADAIVGLGRVWERRRAVRCPECDLPSLGQWLGEETIYCTNSTCAIAMTKGEYEERCEIRAKEKKVSA